MVQLRLSLTISGAVSLGAYEGGAIAGLLCAVRDLTAGDDPPLRVDVICGASAGSITGLLTARALLEGLDPVQVMSRAWVTGDSIGSLLARGTQAPLTMTAIRELGTSVLASGPPGTAAPDGAAGGQEARDAPAVPPSRQRAAIRLCYTLANLRGFQYRLPRLGREPVLADAFIDTFEHTLHPGAPTGTLTGPAGDCPLDAVLASGANEMGFPAYRLDRVAQWPAYLADGVDNLPPGPDRSLWYTDGGTLDNEPLGRTLDLANEADADGADSQRLHLLIHPHPAAAIADDSWARPDRQPTFAQTAARGLTLQRSQSLYDDLKRVEKTNTHISWMDDLAGRLGAALDRLDGPGRDAFVTALTEAVAAMDGAAGDLRAQRRGPDPIPAVPQPGSGGDPGRSGADGAGPVSGLLSRALHQAAGLAGKRPARVDVISPQLLLPGSGAANIDDMLSGEVLMHFGGFLDEKMRRSDFDLGYRSTLQWISDGGLTSAGLPAELSEQAEAAAVAAYSPGEGWKETGKTTTAELLAGHPVEATRLAGRFAHVLLHDLFQHPPP